MNLALSEEQTLLQDALQRLLREEVTRERIRKAEAAGGVDVDLWKSILAFELPGLRVPQTSGGADSSLLDAVLVAEAVGEALAPVPVIEAIVASRLLALAGSKEAGAELSRCRELGEIITIALPSEKGAITHIVPAGSAAAAVLHLKDAGLFLFRPDRHVNINAVGVTGAVRMELSAENSLLLAPVQASITRLYNAAVTEWKLLLAAQINGAAHKSLELSAEYARDRTAFGRPIGSFQGLAHPLAESITDIDGAVLLLWRAVDAIASGETNAAALCAMASWWVANSAEKAIVKAMRTFGGYGVTSEYDVQLYYRRVIEWSRLAGNPEESLNLAGDLIWGGAVSSGLPDAGHVGIGFAEDEAGQSLVNAAAAFTKKHLDAKTRQSLEQSEDGFWPPLYRELASAGLLFPDWPKEHGGAGRDPVSVAAMHRRLAADGWPGVVTSVTNMTGKLIMEFGSDAAKREILPELASGEAVCCLAYSEPACGSDLFAARTVAVRDGNDWLINGQKMFTSQAHIARYALLLARTGSREDKHGSLTVFVVRLDQPGFTYDKIETIDGHRTNVSYFDNVRVPDNYRLGEVNQGVKVLATALAIEQGGDEYFPGKLDALASLALECANSAEARKSDPRIRRRIAAVQTRAHVGRVLASRATWAAAHGRALKHYGPMAKLFASEAWVSSARELMDLFAPDSLFDDDIAFRRLRHWNLASVPATIYAGTSEIQRSLIAESALGLPRSRT
jgi:alkylation response protein AidB-like acyl-CoA dehydrogenase